MVMSFLLDVRKLQRITCYPRISWGGDDMLVFQVAREELGGRT